MPCMLRHRFLRRRSVPESRNLRKRALESLRLAADCMQLARDAHSVALQSHFLRMAETWHALADQALSTGSAGESAGP